MYIKNTDFQKKHYNLSSLWQDAHEPIQTTNTNLQACKSDKILTSYILKTAQDPLEDYFQVPLLSETEAFWKWQHGFWCLWDPLMGTTCNARVNNTENPDLFLGAKMLSYFLKGDWLEDTSSWQEGEVLFSPIFLSFSVCFQQAPITSHSHDLLLLHVNCTYSFFLLFTYSSVFFGFILVIWTADFLPLITQCTSSLIRTVPKHAALRRSKVWGQRICSGFLHLICLLFFLSLITSLLLQKHNVAVGDLCDQISVDENMFPTGLVKPGKKIKGKSRQKIVFDLWINYTTSVF